MSFNGTVVPQKRYFLGEGPYCAGEVFGPSFCGGGGPFFSKEVQIFQVQVGSIRSGGSINCEVFVPGGSKIGGSKFVVTVSAVSLLQLV